MLRWVTTVVGFNGMMHIGVFIVAIPLLLKDYQLMDARSFALIQMTFIVGGVCATLAMLRRGNVEYPGRSVLFCLLYAALILMGLSAGPTLPGLFFLVFLWGVVSGISSSLGRSLIQQQTEEGMRGRSLSVYQLMLLGSAPIGAVISGYLVGWQDAFWLLKVSGIASLVAFFFSLFVQPLWSVKSVTELELRLTRIIGREAFLKLVAKCY